MSKRRILYFVITLLILLLPLFVIFAELGFPIWKIVCGGGGGGVSLPNAGCPLARVLDERQLFSFLFVLTLLSFWISRVIYSRKHP